MPSLSTNLLTVLGAMAVSIRHKIKVSQRRSTGLVWLPTTRVRGVAVDTFQVVKEVKMVHWCAYSFLHQDSGCV